MTDPRITFLSVSPAIIQPGRGDQSLIVFGEAADRLHNTTRKSLMRRPHHGVSNFPPGETSIPEVAFDGPC